MFPRIMVPEVKVILFVSIGGVVAFLPIVLLGLLRAIDLLKSIAIFSFMIILIAIGYLVLTGGNIVEILSLKLNSVILPNRIFVVFYIMIIVFVTLLPVAIVRELIKKNKKT